MAKTMTRKSKAPKPAARKAAAGRRTILKPVVKPAARSQKAAPRKTLSPGRAKTIVEVKRALPRGRIAGVAATKATKSLIKETSPQDAAVLKAFKRIKPLLQQPLDPRISHLVEIFGADTVNALIAAARKSGLVGETEVSDAIARGEAAMGPSPHGAWAWHELMTTDVASTKRFYSSMFGWEASDVEMMPGFNYTIFRRAQREIAGLMAIGPEHGDMPSGWGVYVAVDDVDAAAEKAERLGGEIIVPAHDIPVGRWAMIKDTTGAVLCLYRAKI
jgi:predicted enzyme related to lactoylglutathione lyase